VVTDDIWDSEVPAVKVVVGRRRMLSWLLFAIGFVMGALAIAGSALVWTNWNPAPVVMSPIAVSGLNRAEWGRWTLLLGGVLVLGGMAAGLLVGSYRSLAIVVPALAGLGLSDYSWTRTVSIPTDTLRGGKIGLGLMIVTAAYSAAIVLVAAVWIMDRHWYATDLQLPAS